MNPWQLAQQIKHVLANVQWQGGAAQWVFGPQSVYVYSGQIQDEELPIGFPFAVISIGASTADPEQPDLLTASFSIMAAVEVAGDALGEQSIIGASRVDLGKSDGAGAAEVSERVRAALQDLTGYDGATIVMSGAGTGAPTIVGRGRHIAFEEFQVSALCTSQPHYTAPTALRHSAGAWVWSGAACAPRFDLLRYRLGYVAGTVPVEAPEDLDAIIYTGTDQTFTAVATGSRVYQVFADYDPRGTGLTAGSSNGRDTGAWKAT